MKKISFMLMAFIFLSVLGYSQSVTVSVGAGEHWKEKMGPQFAIWLENEDGSFVRTLYVTNKASKRSFIFCPKEGRPESLPVWYFASKSESSKTSKKDSLDAVSSATPKGGVVFPIELDECPYVIKAEFNTSFDYNEYYTKKNSGVNGQPSVVYSALISLDKLSSDEVRLEFAGTGSLDGKDGNIHKNTNGLTTAKEIVKLVAVKGDKSLVVKK